MVFKIMHFIPKWMRRETRHLPWDWKPNQSGDRCQILQVPPLVRLTEWLRRKPGGLFSDSTVAGQAECKSGCNNDFGALA